MRRNIVAQDAVPAKSPKNQTLVQYSDGDQFKFRRNGVLRYLIVLLLIFCSLSLFAETILQQSFEAATTDSWSYSTNPTPESRRIWWGPTTENMGGANAQEGNVYWAGWDLDNVESTVTFATQTLQSDYTYQLSFWYFTKNLTTTNDYCRYSLMYDTGTNWDNWVTVNNNSNAWTEVTLDIPGGSNYIRLRLSSKFDGTTKYAHWDNITIDGRFTAPIVSNVSANQRTDGSTPPMPENFVLVEGGTFHNGTSNVTVSSFYLDKYELTQAEYQAVMGTNPAYFSGNPNNPVELVSWFNAIEYCNRRSLQEGLTPCYSYGSYGSYPATWPSGWNSNYNNHTNVSCNWTANGYRLPTEAEWEFAARGGNQAHNYTYSGSNTIGSVAWYYDNAYNMGNSHPDHGTHTVGTKLPNELGLYDMSGNVWEWNWDINGSYPSGSQNNPTGSNSGSYRVRRGGGWGDCADGCTVSSRGSYDATDGGSYMGFRVCRVSP
ncbi:MAG: formylglycine-generating enzyme family protein [Candidatus Cloacimonetes bacterium]|nr:formylglycine-generating enzyme family protein [Candidatus Cloacimonadota bacterium]MCK9185485.1 formylglycine-generating enzyme family protein [Candidatus Cloacimonadota bacterium]